MGESLSIGGSIKEKVKVLKDSGIWIFDFRSENTLSKILAL